VLVAKSAAGWRKPDSANEREGKNLLRKEIERLNGEVGNKLWRIQVCGEGLRGEWMHIL
jgi:hypothetical protein